MAADSFFTRWSRRKIDAVSEPRSDRVTEDTPARRQEPSNPAIAGLTPPSVLPVTAPGFPPSDAAPESRQHETAASPPAAELPAIESLSHESDFRPFLQPGVDPQLKNAALKTLFTDPHYNVMEGLDIYIGDYSQPDPIPLSMLKHLHQSKMLGLFDDEEKAEAEKSEAMQEADAAGAGATTGTVPHGTPAALDQNDPGETKSLNSAFSNENESQQP